MIFLLELLFFCKFVIVNVLTEFVYLLFFNEEKLLSIFFQINILFTIFTRIDILFISFYSILHHVFLFKNSLLIIYTILIYYLTSDIIFVRGAERNTNRSAPCPESDLNQYFGYQ